MQFHHATPANLESVVGYDKTRRTKEVSKVDSASHRVGMLEMLASDVIE